MCAFISFCTLCHTLYPEDNQRNCKYIEILYQIKPSCAASRKSHEASYPLQWSVVALFPTIRATNTWVFACVVLNSQAASLFPSYSASWETL